ncbi:MAG: S8 family serine peptidase [Candidatus Hodarchaeota archaeon]
MKTVTIYLRRNQQNKIEDKVERVLESYDSFVLVQADEKQIESLKEEKFKVTVRDEIDEIKIGDAVIDTRESRYDEIGKIRVHSAYVHTRDPGPESHHYIVQFIGPIKEEWKTSVREIGGIICDPLPSYSYIVEMDSQMRNRVIKLPFVRWVGHYDPAYRISPRLIQEVSKTERERQEKKRPKAEKPGTLPPVRKGAPFLPYAFLVSFHTRENLGDAVKKVKALGAIVETVPSKGKTLSFRFPPDTLQLENKLNQLATIHGVRSIEPVRIKQLRNDVATRIITGSLNVATGTMPFTGESEIIAVADSGIDTGDPATVHEDFQGRIVDIRSWPIKPVFDPHIHNPGGDDGPADLDSGHGTHVTGSILGNGRRAEQLGLPPIRGLAYRARLFFQAVEQKLEWISDFDRTYYGEYLLAGLPDDLTELFQQAYDGGARIHNNSWSGGDFGAYDGDARAVDSFVWEHKDMIVLFAASNEGEDRDGDGKVNPTSIPPPGTAKNCITVGASENLRESITATYRDGWPGDFPADPIASDYLADDINDVAAFSSRGPCLDERFKPDVIAPGTFVLSTKSSRATGSGWGNFSADYFYMGGTSMAAPLTAGAVALIREHLRRKRRRMPSAALVKAVLIHTAARRSYRYAAADPGPALWDPEQGWGHVDLSFLVNPPPNWNIRYVDIRKGFETGQDRTYRFDIADQNNPVKATLVWTDFPAGANQYPSLVNNLNLIVTAPDGTDFHGNVFEPPFDGSLDTTNNLEVVMIPQPLPGRYKINVVATDVKEGPQHFALVYSGSIV